MNQKEKILFYFFFTFIIINLSFAQTGGWGFQNSGTDALLMDVFFINADTGWVAGYGIILNTTDGGKNWTVQDSSNMEFWSIHFTDKDHGWAVGYKESGMHGFIYQTTDGGQQWSFGDSTQYELNDVFFVDENTGFAVGGTSRTTILRTTNAGADWEQLDDYHTQLYTVYFHNDTLGWAAGAAGRIFKTEDGGDTWSQTYVNIGLYESIKDIQFVNQNIGWVVGGDSIYKTTNGGDTWESLEGLGNHSYKCCFFINSDVGWAGAVEDRMAKIIYTEDGGNSWQVQESIGVFTTINSIFFIDDHTGWGVGSYGTIQKTTSGGLVSVHDEEFSGKLLPGQFELHQNFPNPFNSITTISYDLPVSCHVSLIVYNLLGEEVIRLVDQKQSAGKHDLVFDGTGLAGGTYYYKLTDARKQMVKKMLLLK